MNETAKSARAAAQDRALSEVAAERDALAAQMKRTLWKWLRQHLPDQGFLDAPTDDEIGRTFARRVAFGEPARVVEDQGLRVLYLPMSDELVGALSAYAFSTLDPEEYERVVDGVLLTLLVRDALQRRRVEVVVDRTWKERSRPAVPHPEAIVGRHDDS